MPAEVLTFVIGGLVLIVVGVLEAVGVMGIFGAVRFSNCQECSHLTMRSSGAEPVCRRCRRHAAAAADAASGDVIAPTGHISYLRRIMAPYLGRPHTP